MGVGSTLGLLEARFADAADGGEPESFSGRSKHGITALDLRQSTTLIPPSLSDSQACESAPRRGYLSGTSVCEEVLTTKDGTASISEPETVTCAGLASISCMQQNRRCVLWHCSAA